MSEGIYLGLDFGTTNSAMAWYDPKKDEARVLLNAEATIGWPRSPGSARALVAEHNMWAACIKTRPAG